MRRSVWMTTMAALALLGASAEAAAQACRGTPPFGKATGSDYGFEGALVFPDEGTGFYGAFKWASSLNLAVDFSGQFVSDIGGGVDVWQFGGTGVYRFFEGNPREFPLDICFLSGFLYFVGTDLPVGDDLNGFLIPIGATFGNDFPLGRGNVRIAPYFAPVLGIQRVNTEVADDTEALFYVDFGASFLFPRGWYVGLGIAVGDDERLPSRDNEIRIRAGKLFGRTAPARGRR